MSPTIFIIMHHNTWLHSLISIYRLATQLHHVMLKWVFCAGEKEQNKQHKPILYPLCDQYKQMAILMEASARKSKANSVSKNVASYCDQFHK